MKTELFDFDPEHKTIVFSNEDLINDNFVEIITGDSSIIVLIDELYETVSAFKRLKNASRENDLFYTKINNND